MSWANKPWYRADVVPVSVFSAELIHEPAHGALAVTLHDADGRLIYPLAPTQPSDIAAFVPTISPVYIKVETPDGGKETRRMVWSKFDGWCLPER